MVGAGNALSVSGPVAIIISYTVVGVLVYAVLCALGEVAAAGPVPSTVFDHAERFCDPALGFTLGWIYWLKYLVVMPNQLTAAALIISYWLDAESVNPGVWITAFLALIITANYLATPFFGKFEFFLSAFKVLVVLGLIILSTVLVFGGGPDHNMKMFRYWKNPGPFPYNDTGVLGKIRAISRTMPSATFAYIGSELIGMSILHTPDPRRTASQAIRLTFYRIFVFNILCVTLVGMLIPYDSELLAFAHDAVKPTMASVFVVVIQLAKLNALPSILNACILIFVLSSANYGLHMSTKTIYGLSRDKNAPAFLSRTDQRGTPVYALGVCSTLASLAYLNVSSNSKALFGYFVNLVTMFGLLTWISILITHISFVRALKAQGVPDEALTFRAPLGSFGSGAALVCCFLVSLMRGFEIIDQAASGKGFDYTNFITSYLGIPLYLCLVIGYKLVTRCKRIKPIEADLWSDRSVIAMGVAEEKASKQKGLIDRIIGAWLL
ncbi:hypothetical protein AWENTII_003473 [Aspergillus wentii]